MIHILLRYLGIKTKMLDHIDEQVDILSKEGETLLDLFAGSNIVGQYFSNKRRIYSNDIQRYSYTVAKATLDINKKFDYKLIDITKIEESNYFKENYKKILGIFDGPLKYEKNLIIKCKNNASYDNLLELKTLYDNTPYIGHYSDKVEAFKSLEKYYTEEYYNSLKNNNEYMLFTLNYAMPYFTLNQAVYIDSFRCAIEKLHNDNTINDTEYYIYLSLLIYGLECSVSSIGDHFAQPQIFKLEKEKKYKKGLEKLLIKKSISIHDVMDEKQSEFIKIDKESFYEGNKCFCMDCIELLKDSEIMKNVDIIYIDPPYTNAHYSRFYHILETLVTYNYPKIEFNGRYSSDRYQSPFCQKKNAYNEFSKMIELCSVSKKKLIISYSDTNQCLITYDEIKKICEKYYSTVRINKVNYLYRNLGQKPNKVSGNELLITCEKV